MKKIYLYIVYEIYNPRSGSAEAIANTNLEITVDGLTENSENFIFETIKNKIRENVNDSYDNRHNFLILNIINLTAVFQI